MFKNYILTSWRSIRKNKLYSLLNIAGLAIGLASFILISHYVLDELSYDHWIKDSDRIYRIDGDLKFGGTAMNIAVVSDPMGPTIVKEYPQVEQYVRFYQDGPKLIKKGPEFIRESAGNMIHADSTLLDIFSFKILAGEKQRPLNGRDKVIISESMAKKYFGNIEYNEIIGKTLETDDDPKFYTVTAVMQNIPRNTHFHFDMIFTISNIRYEWNNWLSNNLATYIKLKEGVTEKEINPKFREMVVTYAMPQAAQFMDVKSLDQFEQAGNHLNYSLMPLTDIHLHSNKVAELAAHGNIQYVYIFSAIAFFILIIACINFMNLATARSANRAKEVGVRKVLGTQKSNLIFQFLSESTLMAYISTAVGIGLAFAFLNIFNSIAYKEYSIMELLSIKWIIALVLLPLLVGAIAGLYPAFYLSAFRPIEVLKSKIHSKGYKDVFRSSLVVFQFITSILLIVGSVVIYKQLNFIKNTNIGFNKEQVLIIDGAQALGNSLKSFKDEVSAYAGIQGSTYTGFLPVSNSNRNDNVYFKTPTPDIKTGLNMQIWRIDENYIPMLGMEIIKGRNFSKDMKTDSGAVILNEEAIRLLGYQENTLDQAIYAVNDDAPPTKINIIGVVKNFNFESLRQEVGPLAFFLGTARSSIGFKLNSSEAHSLIHQIETKWRSMANGAPFTYRFLDDSFNEMYRSEQRIGKIALVFSVLAIFIACLGLFGLASFMAEQRTKELGVRKVLGAGVYNLITLLSKDFIKLVIIAFAIAVPVSWYFMHRWLQDFAYRINLSWWMFGIAGIVSLAIALISVSSQAVKAALANPIRSLRTE